MSVSASALLSPSNLTHYSASLLLNLSSDSGKSLSLAKLKTLKQSHLSMMGISDFDDQKVIMKAVKEVVKGKRVEGTSLDDKLESEASAEPKPDKTTRKERKSFGRGSFDKKKSSRSSFDRKSQMDKINSMRGELDSDAKAKKLDSLRRRSFDPDQKGSAKNDLMSEVEKNVEADEHAEARITGMGPKGPRKKMANDTELSFTFSASSTETAEKAKRKEKAQQYGNSAQRTAKADDGLHKLGVKIIQAFKDDIKCEKATIIFFDNLKSEMFFYIGETRYRFSQDSGIAGEVLKSGQILNVPDVYSHPKFNRSLDSQTGFKTKSILCAPIRSRSGANDVVAVVQMLNKIGDAGAFTDFDEELIGNCSFRVAEALDLQFSTLVNAQIDMERLSLDDGTGKKKPTYTKEIGEGGAAGDEKPLYEGSRVVSLNRERDSFADVRRKRVDEYGKEIRDSKVGV
ncbi:hypothetical protein TrVE_jg10607 [Triparma verrucosa]|uniref:GAF domain-containing protein n=1 Tax=Triparma verrucosa TaxID=1606542 RepID=A0A9W7CBL5_9STRA|nr:hypothetical protein TrVE_jg10607 [Triparma verrucosa]